MQQLKTRPKLTLKKFTPSALLILLASSLAPHDQGFTFNYWNVGNGNWSVPDNWTASTVPNAIDDPADLDDVSSVSANTITVDSSNFIIGSLSGGSAGTLFTITSSPSTNTLTFQATSPASPTLSLSEMKSLNLYSPIVIASPTLDVTASGMSGAVLLMTGTITGSTNTMNVTGTGELLLQGTVSNDLQNLVVSGATVNLDGSSGILTTSNLTVSGGIANLQVLNQLYDGTNVGSIDIESGSLTFANDQTVDTFTLNGGSFTQNAHNLTVQTQVNLGDSTLLFSSSPGHLVLNAGAGIAYTGTSSLAEIQEDIDLGTGTTVIAINPITTHGVGLQIDQVISNGAISTSGDGIVRLLGVNTYEGGTTLNDGGTFQIGSTGSLYTAGSVTLNDTSTFDISLSAGVGISDLISSSDTTTVDLGARTLTINTSSTPDFAGQFTGGGSLVMAGSGTQTLSGTTNNAMKATVNSGTLELNKSGAYAIDQALVINTGGTVICSKINQFNDDTTSTVTLSGGTWNIGVEEQSFGIFYYNSGTLGQTTGTLAVESLLQLVEGTTVSGPIKLKGNGAQLSFNPTISTQSITVMGDINLGGNTTGLIDVLDSTSTMTLSGSISNGGFIKAGTGTVILTGNNLYSGGTAVDVGIIQAGATGTFPLSGTVNLDPFDVDPTPAATFDLHDFDQKIGNLAGSPGSKVTLGLLTTTTLDFGRDGGSSEFDGVISGAGGIIKSGTGTTTFKGANSYGQDTEIHAGTLKIGSSAVLPSTTLVNLTTGGASAATLDVNNAPNVTIGNLTGVNGTFVENIASTFTVGDSSDQTFHGIISGIGSLTKTGSGILTFTGANTYSGGTIINNGTISISEDANLGTGNITFDPSGNSELEITGDITSSKNITLNASGTIQVNGGSMLSSLTLTGMISGGSGNILTKSGDGILTLEGTNSYSGGTVISSGTLALSHASSIGTGFLTINNADDTSVFDISQLTNGGVTIGDLTTAGPTTISLGSNTLTIKPTNPSTICQGPIEDGGINPTTGGSVIIEGASETKITFEGTNTYTGGTTIDSGTLQIANDDNLGIGGAITFGSPGTGILEITSGPFSTSRLIHLDANGSISPDSGISATFSGVIDGTSLTQIGLGTTTLTGDNTYTGGTFCYEGTLALKDAGTIGGGSLLLSNTTGSPTFDISQATAGISITDLTAASGTTIALGANALTIQPTISTNCASKIQDTGLGSGSGGSLIVDGATGTTLTLSGPNIYTGGTTIEQGTLAVSSDSNLGASSGTITLEGGILEITSAAFTTTARDVHLNGSGRILTDSGVGITFSGTINELSSSSLTKDGDGTLTLTAANPYSGGTTVLEGTLALSASGTIGTGSLTLTNTDNTTKFDITQLTPSTGISVTNLATDTGTTISLGSKTLTVSPNSFAVCNSVIQDTGIGSGTGGKLVLDGTALATLPLTGMNTYTGGTTINGGTLSLSGYGTIGTGGLTLNDNSETSTFDISGISPATSYLISDVNGDANTFIELGNNNLTITPTAADVYSGVIRDYGSGSLTLSSGTLTLEGANTYAGGTIVGTGVSSPTLNIVSPGSLYSTGSLTLNNNSIFNISSGGDQAIGDLNGDTGSGITLGSNTLTLNLLNSDEFDGIITGNTGTGGGSLFVSGNGTLTLTNSSTYSSTTVDTDADLFIDTPATITNPQGFTVDGFLGGTGTVNVSPSSSLTIASGGILSPGNSIGTFHIIGNYVQAPGSFLFIELGNPPLGDLVEVTSGTATVKDSILQLEFLAFPTIGDSWTIVTATGGVTTGDFSSIESKQSLVNVTAIYNPTDIVITFGGINPIHTVVTQGNPGAVAMCVDSTTIPMSSDLGKIITALALDSTAGLYYALNQLQPSAFKGLAVSQQNIFLEVENSLSHRFISFFPTTCEKETRMKRPTVWLDTFGSTLTQGEKTVAPYSPQPSYTTKSFGILAGADSMLTKNFAVGLTTGYSRGIYSMHSNAGTGSVDSFYVGPYAKFGHENDEISPYLTASILGEANWYDTNRHIIFDTVNRTARGSHTGQGLLFHIGGGAWIKAGYVDISPFANFDLIAMQENSYTESGADALNLHVHQSTYQFNEYEGGVMFRGCIKLPHGMIVPQISLSALRENRDQGADYTASLEGNDGCAFVVEGYYPDRTLFIPAAEIKGRFFKERFTASLYYQGKFGDDFSQNELGLQFAYTF